MRTALPPQPRNLSFSVTVAGLACATMAVALLASSVVATAAAQALPVPVVPSDSAAAVLGELAMLAREKEFGLTFVERLEVAFRKARGVPASAALMDGSERQQQARMWLELLRLVEAAIDPTFDPASEPMPARRVIPGACNGFIPSGAVAPETIPCPDVRTKYEAALRANEVRRQRVGSQTQLRVLQLSGQRGAQLSLKAIYLRSASPGSEFQPILDASALSESTKATVRMWVSDPR